MPPAFDALPSSSLAERNALRALLRAQRRRLPGWRQRRAAAGLAAVVLRQPAVRRASRIACYLPADGEIDPLPLMAQLRARGKQTLLPVVGRDRQLRFRRFPAPRLRRNRFGIAEPQGATLAPRQLDLVLLPLVAFDRHGGRLGMGGGFYDRTFAFRNGAFRNRAFRNRAFQNRAGGMRMNGGPQLIGLAHHFQEVPALALAEWDVPLAAVATDRGWITTRR